MQNRVHFIKGQPIFDLIFIAFKDCTNIILIKSNYFTISPSVVLPCQVQWHFIVRQGDQRFDIILSQFVKNLIVEDYPASFGSASSPFGKIRDQAIDMRIEAQLCKQRNILFIAVIEIYTFKLQIIWCCFFSSQRLQKGHHLWESHLAQTSLCHLSYKHLRTGWQLLLHPREIISEMYKSSFVNFHCSSYSQYDTQKSITLILYY